MMVHEAADEIERLRAALRLYVNAGFGNSTDHFKQGAAYDAAVEALGPNVRAKTPSAAQRKTDDR